MKLWKNALLCGFAVTLLGLAGNGLALERVADTIRGVESAKMYSTFVPICNPNTQYLIPEGGKLICKDFPSCAEGQVLTMRNSQMKCEAPTSGVVVVESKAAPGDFNIGAWEIGPDIDTGGGGSGSESPSGTFMGPAYIKHRFMCPAGYKVIGCSGQYNSFNPTIAGQYVPESANFLIYKGADGEGCSIEYILGKSSNFNLAYMIVNRSIFPFAYNFYATCAL